MLRPARNICGAHTTQDGALGRYNIGGRKYEYAAVNVRVFIDTEQDSIILGAGVWSIVVAYPIVEPESVGEPEQIGKVSLPP